MVATIISASDGLVEEWVASPGGGFSKATFDMPKLLSDAALPHLYDRLVAEDLGLLTSSFERLGREGFISYLKDEIGLDKLSDRQLFTNAIARAKRIEEKAT